MFDNLCKSWPRESQQCINRLKNKQTSYRVLNTVLIKVLYERFGSWPQKCYGDGYSTGWLRHFIVTRRYEFFNFRSAEARSGNRRELLPRQLIWHTVQNEEWSSQLLLLCNVHKNVATLLLELHNCPQRLLKSVLLRPSVPGITYHRRTDFAIRSFIFFLAVFNF